MRWVILNIILVSFLELSAQHTIKTPYTTFTVTDTFTVNACKFFFMEYDSTPYLCIRPSYSVNKFVGVVGDGTNGKKYRAEVILVNSNGWDVLQLDKKDIYTVCRTHQLIIFTDRGPILLPIKLPMQHRIRAQTLIILK